MVHRRAARVLASALLLVVVATLVQPMTGVQVLPERRALAFSCPQPVNIINGSFESPTMSTGSSYQFIADAQVPGWSTSASDGMFEFWRSGFQGVPAVAGNQFVELNANVPGTVSQVIDTSTLQGHTIEYSFWHRGRSGTDTMRVSIGPPGGVANFTRTVSTGRTAWVQYSGTYTVPVGQTSTQFAYGAVSSSGGLSYGNLLDDIRFGTPPCSTDLGVVKTATPTRYLPGQPVTFTIVVTNTGASPQQYDLVGARLVDTVPAAITGVSWTCSATAGSACGAASGSGNAIDTTYNILEGGRITYTVTGTAPASGVPDPLSNTATVSTPAGVSDTNSANNTSTVVVPKAIAALSIVKSSTTPGSTLFPGDVVTYRFSVTNIGQVPLTNVTVTDPLVGLSAIDCDGDNVLAALAVGTNAVCTATYTVTLADFIAGSIDNTVTATGTPPPGITPPTATDSLTTPSPPAPAVTVVKSSDASGPVAVGDEITYSYAVTNTGNVPLDITVTDDHAGLSAIDCDGDATVDGMPPGGPITCTATYTVTQADVDAGSIDNTVDVVGVPPVGGTVSDTDTLTIDTVAPDPGLAIDKTASFDEPVVVGAVVTYSIGVSNTGNVTLSDVRVRDPLVGLSAIDCGDGTNLIAAIDPADPPVVCTATYRVRQSDVDRGGITNTANATATTPPGTPPVPQVFDGTAVPIDRNPAVSITKSTDATGDLAPGQTVTYTFSVSNTGDVTLVNLVVDDPLPGLSDIDCDGDNVIASLAPGAAPVECTATYVVTAADADNGSFSNTATVTGTPAGSTTTVTDSDTVTSPVDQSPELTLEKVATATTPITVGDVITYTFRLTNSGNVTLTDVTVTDPLVGLSPIDCGDGDAVIDTFAPGGPITCTATYTVTQADVDAGNIHNTATATGTPPPGAPDLVPPVATEDVPIDRATSIDIVKSSDLVSPNEVLPGTVITYEFSVTNTGDVTLSDVTVTDVLPGMSAIDCDGDNVVATLAPGTSTECTATYTVTADDIDNGIVQNTATATGTPPAGLTPPTDSDTHNSPFDPLPAITIDKTADADAPLVAGDVVTYTFRVTNTGNVSLTAVTVTDDTLPGLSAIDCGDGTATIARLAAGSSRACTATYEVGQDDVDNGEIVNTASVVGTPPLGGDPVSDDDDETIDIPAEPALAVDKSASPAGPVQLGDEITYTIVVTNTGNVTLSDVTVTDDSLPGLSAIDCGAGAPAVATLAPGASATCEATYVVDQVAADAGEVTNVAYATGTPPGGEPLPPVPGTVTVDVEQVAAMTLTKSASPAGNVAVDDVVTYTFTVTNTGTVTLSDITVSDVSLPGLSAIDCGAGTATIESLLPDDSADCIATYTVTQDDVDAGAIANSATATGSTPPGAPEVPPAEGETEVPIERTAGLAVVKSSDATADTAVDDVVEFTFTVSNTGNVSLTDVTVTDPLDGLSPVDCGDGSATIALLLPGSPVECTATYTVTQDDVDSGLLSNTVTVTGTPPDGVDPPDPATDTNETPFEAVPGLALTKSNDAAAPVAVGDIVTYTFTVENTGNVTLTDVTVTDPLTGLSAIDCGDGSPTIASLDPADDPVECTATYTVTQDDVDAGTVDNTASATGTPPDGEPLPPVTAESTVTIARTPAMTLTKSADPATAAGAGDVITYSFTVTNTGNVTLTGVTVSDPLSGLSAIDCGGGSATIASLAPGGAPVVCTATYTVTQDDADAGSVANTATLTATPPPGVPPLDPVDSGVEVPIPPAPALSIDKAAAIDLPAVEGDTITYSITVANTGNVTLTSVTVTDPLAGLSAIDCGDGSATIAVLAPTDAPVVCTATYSVTLADLDAGSVTNTASATGTPPGGGTIPPVTDTAITPLDGTPRIAIDKVSGGVNDVDGNGASAGDTVTFFFVVTNTGAVTLDNVVVDDPLLGGRIPCGSGPLAPGASRQCDSAVYVLTGDDVSPDGPTELENTATVTATSAGGSTVSATDTVVTPVPPECAVAPTTTTSSTSTTSTSTSTTVAVVLPTEPAATDAPESSEPAATEPAATEPAATEPAATEAPATEAPVDTEPSAVTGAPAPLRGAAGEYRAPALAPVQADPCVLPPTTTTSTTIAGPTTTSSGGGGGGTLPATGGGLAAPTAIAMVLVAAGAAVVVTIRRRRVT